MFSGLQGGDNRGEEDWNVLVCAGLKGVLVVVQEETCQVWQHKECSGYDMSPGGTNFFCQQCRCKRADPFWEDVGVAVLPFMRLRCVGPGESHKS